MQTEHKLLRHKFYSSIVADILKALEGGSFGGAFILSFCCIDYFSTPIALQKNKLKPDKNDFKSFISEYMAKANPKYSILHNQLYAIRCSLVHSYGESDATNKIQLIPHLLYGDDITDLHLTFENDRILYINLADFVSELIAAIEHFFQLNSESIILNEWYLKLYIPQNLKATFDRSMIKMGEPINYKSIHKMLEILESNATPEIIQSTLKSIIETKINLNLNS